MTKLLYTTPHQPFVPLVFDKWPSFDPKRDPQTHAQIISASEHTTANAMVLFLAYFHERHQLPHSLLEEVEAEIIKRSMGVEAESLARYFEPHLEYNGSTNHRQLNGLCRWMMRLAHHEQKGGSKPGVLFLPSHGPLAVQVETNGKKSVVESESLATSLVYKRARNRVPIPAFSHHVAHAHLGELRIGASILVLDDRPPRINLWIESPNLDLEMLLPSRRGSRADLQLSFLKEDGEWTEVEGLSLLPNLGGNRLPRPHGAEVAPGSTSRFRAAIGSQNETAALRLTVLAQARRPLRILFRPSSGSACFSIHCTFPDEVPPKDEGELGQRIQLHAQLVHHENPLQGVLHLPMKYPLKISEEHRRLIARRFGCPPEWDYLLEVLPHHEDEIERQRHRVRR